MSDALKPCPFCASSAVMDFRVVVGITEHLARCDNESCFSRGPAEQSRDAAVAAWNRRVVVVTDAREPRNKVRELLAAWLTDFDNGDARSGELAEETRAVLAAAPPADTPPRNDPLGDTTCPQCGGVAKRMMDSYGAPFFGCEADEHHSFYTAEQSLAHTYLRAKEEGRILSASRPSEPSEAALFPHNRENDDQSWTRHQLREECDRRVDSLASGYSSADTERAFFQALADAAYADAYAAAYAAAADAAYADAVRAALTDTTEPPHE